MPKLKIEDSVNLKDGRMMSWGFKKMSRQSGGVHTRGAEFYTEAYAGDDANKKPPLVNVTIYSPGFVNNTGTIFAVSQIKVRTDGSPPKTQIAINAQLVSGDPALDVYCSFVAIGRPLKEKPPTKTRKKKSRPANR